MCHKNLNIFVYFSIAEAVKITVKGDDTEYSSEKTSQPLSNNSGSNSLISIKFINS